jgi:hypothetical protein
MKTKELEDKEGNWSEKVTTLIKINQNVNISFATTCDL